VVREEFIRVLCAVPERRELDYRTCCFGYQGKSSPIMEVKYI
jgi:hypothetical protein